MPISRYNKDWECVRKVVCGPLGGSCIRRHVSDAMEAEAMLGLAWSEECVIS
jgi:hypothetical protein